MESLGSVIHLEFDDAGSPDCHQQMLAKLHAASRDPCQHPALIDCDHVPQALLCLDALSELLTASA